MHVIDELQTAVTRLELELELRTNECEQAQKKARDVESARRGLAELRDEHTRQSDRCVVFDYRALDRALWDC